MYSLQRAELQADGCSSVISPGRWRNGGSQSVSVLAGLNQAERATRFRLQARPQAGAPLAQQGRAGGRHLGGVGDGIAAAGAEEFPLHVHAHHALVADGAARASWSNRWDFSATRASFAPVKLESLTGIVGSRANSSNAMLYAVERGAGVGVLPTCSIGFGRTVGRVR